MGIATRMQVAKTAKTTGEKVSNEPDAPHNVHTNCRMRGVLVVLGSTFKARGEKSAVTSKAGARQEQGTDNEHDRVQDEHVASNASLVGVKPDWYRLPGSQMVLEQDEESTPISMQTLKTAVIKIGRSQ